MMTRSAEEEGVMVEAFGMREVDLFHRKRDDGLERVTTVASALLL